MVNTCLICKKDFLSYLAFTDILMLKNNNKNVCQDCKGRFEKVEGLTCPYCCQKNPEICNDCQNWQKRGYKVSHQSLYYYNEAMKEYFSSYKFQGDYSLRKVFSGDLKKVILNNYSDYQLVPVPLSSEREKIRGFNQVTAVLDAANLIYTELLYKKEVEKQSSMNKRERENRDNPFILNPKHNFQDKILIIDDIYTTGTTIFQIHELIKNENIKVIKSLSIAR